MSVNLSLIRNIDLNFKDIDGRSFDVVIIGESQDKRNMFAVRVLNIFDNDYELLFALKNAFLTLEQAPTIKANTPTLEDDFFISPRQAELLRNSHAMSDFVNSTYFSLNGNMIRFNLDKEGNTVNFINQRKDEMSLKLNGSIISNLPEIFIQYNMAKLRRDLRVYQQFLKVGARHEIIDEKKNKLNLFEESYFTMYGDGVELPS